jgi:hypothetical protein
MPSILLATVTPAAPAATTPAPATPNLRKFRLLVAFLDVTSLSELSLPDGFFCSVTFPFLSSDIILAFRPVFKEDI